jgi:hypothetical protein
LCQYGEGRFHTVTPRSPANARKAASESIARSGRTTRVAPRIRVGKISSSATSKAGEANCSTRSSGDRASSAAIAAAWLASAPCETTTPLGVPVLPEV